MKSKIKKYTISPLALSFWIPFLVLIGYFAYRKMAPFGSNSILTVDLGQQYIDQFAAFKYTILQHPSSFFYSFSNALGGDMLGEWAYYLMSPFNFIFLFVSNANLPSAILLVICLKISAAGLSMGYLLKNCIYNMATILPSLPSTLLYLVGLSLIISTYYGLIQLSCCHL
jgi:Predicted membrane protein